jgi:hypothetical protein
MANMTIDLLHKGSFLCNLDTADFSLMLLQTAAAVLTECTTMPVGDEEFVYPIQGVAGILSRRLNMNVHGLRNALQTQAEFLYESIPAICSAAIFYHLKPEGFQLIIDALEAYQLLKTRVVQYEQKIYGPNWKSALPFTKKDWTDRNGQLRKFANI